MSLTLLPAICSVVIRLIHGRNVFDINAILQPVREHGLDILCKLGDLVCGHVPSASCTIGCNMRWSGVDEKGNVRHSILLRHSKESHTGVIPIPIISSVTEKKRFDSRSVRGYFLRIVPTVSTHVVSI